MGIDKTIEKFCVQTAVYWSSPVEDGYGQKTYAAPVEISCRWEDRTDLVAEKGVSKAGQLIVSKAKVLVTQDLDEQGWLYLGSLDDFDSTVDTAAPQTIDGAYEIKRFDKLPFVKSTTIFVRTAYL